MAKNYLRESRLSHKQAKKTLTSAIVLSEIYCFARVLLLLGSFFVGWLVLSKLPFAREWNLPSTVFGVFATLTRFDLPVMQIVVQWVGILTFVGVVLAVIFNIVSAQLTLLKAFRDVDFKLFGKNYLEAREEYKRSIAYVFAYRKLLKEVEIKNNLAKGWHKVIHNPKSTKKVFNTKEFNSKLAEKDLKKSNRALKKAKRAEKKAEKKLLKSKRNDLKATKKARKQAKKKWKKYWKDQRKEAIAQAKQNIGTKKENLKLLKAKKKELRKAFNEKASNLSENHKETVEIEIDQTVQERIAALMDEQSVINVRKEDIKMEVGALRKYIDEIEEYVGNAMSLSKRRVCQIARSNFWALKQIKIYEKRFKKKVKNCKKSLSREVRNKILYRRCRNVRELLFPERSQMRPTYLFQRIIDAFDFMKGFKKVPRIGIEHYQDDDRSYKSIFGIKDYFENYDIDPTAYEVNGYDEGIRKAGNDFTQWKRGSKGDSIYLYERPIFTKYTYNKGFCINLRDLVYYTFLTFFVVALLAIFKTEISTTEYFKSLYLMFIPIGVGTIFHFSLGCWAGTIVKVRADEDIGEWFDVTLADQFDRNVGELLPLRNHERRTGSIVKNTRRNRAFILQQQPREHSVTLYFFRNLCQFFAMAGLMSLEISFMNAVGQEIGAATKVAGGLSQILAWAMIGVLVLSLLCFKVISRYVFSMNEYNVDCMEDDVRAKARNRYKAPMLFLSIFAIVLLVVLILMGLMEISYLATAGLLFFLALVAWLADCVIHHKDIDVDDYGFFMESDSEEERDPSDSY